MSALRWGRGAAGLGWALRPAGRPGLPAEEGALRGFCGRRNNSSAHPCEQDPRKDWGHAELLEVLEARVRQLQAECVSEMTVKRVDVAGLQEGGILQPSRKTQMGARDAAQGLSGRWAQKLEREKQKQLKNKFKDQALMLIPGLRLQMKPRLQDKRLSNCLQRWVSETPSSPWEEQLTQLLQDAPRKLSQEAEEDPADMAVLARLESQQHRLQSFFECCLLSDHLPLAHHVLAAQHSKVRHPRLLTLAMYNTVMLGWARKGSFKELVFVFYMMKDAGLTPDLLSYAAALQCMGRLDKDARTIKRCLTQMAQDGLQLGELFTMPLCPDERAALLKAVLKVQPSFQPPPLTPPPPQVNSSPLLSEVYAQDLSASYPKLHLPLKTLQDLFQEQLCVELATVVHVQSVDKAPEETREVLRARKILGELRAQWEGTLAQALQAAKVKEARAAHEGFPSVFPYLCLLSEQDMVQLLLQTLRNLSPHGESLLSVAQELGMRVFNRYTVQRKQLNNQVKVLEQRYYKYLHLLASDTQVATPRLPRQYWEELGLPDAPHEQPWPLPVLVQLGKQLAEVLVKAIQMPKHLATPKGDQRNIPVLYHAYSFRSYRQIGILKPHPAFMQLVEDAAERELTFEASEMPMLCPPLPWMSPHSGAFLLSPTKLMRSMEGTTQHQRLLDSCPPADLHGALDTLTQLGNCAWQVNGTVLDLVLQLFTDKGCPRLGVPAPTSEAPQPPSTRLPPDTPPARKAEVRRELARCLKVTREMHSLWADARYRLSLAQHLRNHIFWLPHNMDFRGRTYPCPPHFNHLGSDLARALLEFAEGRPLGPHGLDWLKIHLVNLTGLKKHESLQGRLAFANEKMEDVLDSADQPMTGRKWWMEADEPWQALACCMEIARAVRAPDPAAYVSHFPIHQDGSCNGLQHYAALGRDSMGAAAVNLMPSDLPQDVYSGVADQVEVFRRQDAEQGVQVAQTLEGFISRKVVKQTVMTVVYGVTRYGGRLQIEKRLRELDSFPQECVWEASHYLVRQVFNSLQEMFSGSRAIQHWLTEAARLIAQSGSAVEWVTPLGIPVVQPYHLDCKVLVNGGMQTLTLSSSGDTSQPNTLKQKNGFPPNFIHSLDSSHMMLTALHCYRKGLTFVSVHDCFWTHAADVPVMNQVCREQFFRLHSHPILQDLSAFLLKRFCSCSSSSKDGQRLRLQNTLLSVPERGSLDLEQVKHSTYFFS
ncbi:DNA-directed RNA polymerase, mitochondrial isoform X2 [Talpa occidentalis]|uniref:DNA-directed RNA polymerase, mitochondrial isoform X2 n=1 Tax=Talpa occidentalis TaxID=50954 RepID=UPI0023FA3C06|nr:DNA-directed RNA polymerase, mitochondrial isoform X2 [Talpa occidentalis]